jgi:putative redox protein
VDYEVKTENLRGQVTSLGSASGHTLVIDRPAAGGGGGLGFNGAELLHLAVAGCVSNDLFREASALGIRLDRVRIVARGAFAGDPPVSTGVTYDIELGGDASEDQLRALVARVDEIAEIPNCLRRGTPVRLDLVQVRASTGAGPGLEPK